VRYARAHVALERALSKLGLASRTEARRLIAAGRVSVNGRVERDPLAPVVPEESRVAIDGVAREAAPCRFLLLHKPRGVVTTRRDPEGRPTVFDLLGNAGDGLAAVGRLDLASSGLLLLTNDTRLADWLTSPASAVPRVYLVTVRGEVTDDEAKRLEAGVTEGGEKVSARSAVVRKRSRRESHLVVTLAEGRNREIRRLCAAVGHEVTRLRRVAFGGLELGDLAPGRWRELSVEDLRAAFGAGAPLGRGPVGAGAQRGRG
jgi:23S rRNA pseudouridine2605 synthase